MAGKQVDHIMHMINGSKNCDQIKKLLFYRLEIELNAKRCVINIPEDHNVEVDVMEVDEAKQGG